MPRSALVPAALSVIAVSLALVPTPGTQPAPAKPIVYHNATLHTAAADEPIAGGRHKVFGRHDLAIIPQTSTIASHLPRALGAISKSGSRWPL